jgi:hypothetical protein
MSECDVDIVCVCVCVCVCVAGKEQSACIGPSRPTVSTHHWGIVFQRESPLGASGVYRATQFFFCGEVHHVCVVCTVSLPLMPYRTLLPPPLSRPLMHTQPGMMGHGGGMPQQGMRMEQGMRMVMPGNTLPCSSCMPLVRDCQLRPLPKVRPTHPH